MAPSLLSEQYIGLDLQPPKDNHMETLELTREAPAPHAHHWVIEEASGPLSGGRCKTCGAIKEFKNWLADGDFITNEEHRLAA